MSSKGGLAVGNSHSNGGIKKVLPNGDAIEIEGSEVVINKANVLADKPIRVEGTTKQVLSLINEMDGNGVKFADTKGAKLEKLKRGGEIKKQCPVGTQIQTILFKKENFTEQEARKWLDEHGFRNKKVDDTENMYRFRQQSPLRFDEDSFKTITLKTGIEAVIACPSNKKEKGGEIESGSWDIFETIFLFKL